MFAIVVCKCTFTYSKLLWSVLVVCAVHAQLVLNASDRTFPEKQVFKTRFFAMFAGRWWKKSSFAVPLPPKDIAKILADRLQCSLNYIDEMDVTKKRRGGGGGWRLKHGNITARRPSSCTFFFFYSLVRDLPALACVRFTWQLGQRWLKVNGYNFTNIVVCACRESSAGCCVIVVSLPPPFATVSVGNRKDWFDSKNGKKILNIFSFHSFCHALVNTHT